MAIGFATLAIGYVIFYWGLHHMPQYTNERYSLWYLFGMGTLFPSAKSLGLATGQPFQLKG